MGVAWVRSINIIEHARRLMINACVGGWGFSLFVNSFMFVYFIIICVHACVCVVSVVADRK